MEKALRNFLSQESAGGILLLIAVALAMVLANSPLAGVYQGFLDTPMQLRLGALDINKPLLLWINDGLMALFFLLIGLEVKRELLEGALSSVSKASLPTFAAIGGMLVPAAVYLLFNANDPVTQGGWAIPAATDIAFALGIMALLGNRVPVALKVFLLALAIIDDLGVIVIIALFYSSDLSMISLVIAAAAVIGLIILNRRGVTALGAYGVLGAILWVAVLKSGVHATLAGVIIAFCIPLRDKQGGSPSEHLEHTLHPWSTFLILPVFAFANAGVALGGMSLESLVSPVPLGIALGLLLGKPIGVVLFSFIAVKLRLAELPEGIAWRHIIPVAVMCGIGFTMSMFIASLAFEHGGVVYSDLARLGILIGSMLAAVVGYFWLSKVLPEKGEKE
ncbi:MULTISPECIES: Na+/H+ antiporter NhaA [Shewanella]|jgi:NhaA family Na+:H+ antiporter|uniref:Na(+)/H(+) antiporter NhaA n=1 Tax=Shewanella chilikensis TaxID=558541 RepID=A0A6G7LPW8_9GAMM|nr:MULTISPECIES: Na+/H+ antiporter NhaA [Shewanella]MCA0951069.1 Na+/H+ antiporter NhaA [Shewanella chilikensis]MCL1152428.1 Na+/H+ antiporter NhaA [Shewanella chilikensis]PYE59246.1 sodium/proton antiporter (NhaA family) [Shewanella chilikensis]QIJ03876.1 Na+/H+ antiporter NhaA [Shewanella chilikensis]QWL03567.1 Na+/H+ antiporter NhaA [Shewanella indica]